MVMVEIISEIENLPSVYPLAPAGLSVAAEALDANAIWQRIESWISWRWTPRDVTWIVNGPGVWTPRLKPAAITAIDLWDGGWITATPYVAPIGYELDIYTYRFTATVGGTSDTPPSAVLEAFRRLAEYLADDSHIGRVATSGSRQIGDMQINARRSADWQARAIHYSGAADLLRPWRM